MGKGLRVHLRLNETDRDLCRWRHSIRCNMLTSYVSQILKAEACGEIAVLPVFDKISADDTPCDVYMLIDDTDIIEFITSIPVYRRNSRIKSIIRKHLHSQMTANGKALFGFAEPAAKSRPKANKEREISKPTVYEEPKTQVNEEEHGETDEDREALLALIALGGE